jgi:nucleoside-diphosphate-sugar epimerase
MKKKKSDKPRVLVTGASGFIAGHCVRELLEHGYAVRGTVRSLADDRKVAHLERLGAARGASLELVEADLTSDEGWSAAVDGCAYVLHVASPFPASVPEDENEIVGPAVEGTRRVLEACAASGKVRRVVLTSSVAAIAFGHGDSDGKVFDEGDWSNVERCEPYQKSKTLAERSAWDFVAGLPADKGFELAVINPGFVAGPVLNSVCGTSGEVVRRLLTRDLPACPQIGWALVDVRDVASAHRLAMETPAAAGNRYIVAGDHVWMQDAARMLAEEFGPLGYRVPTGKLPYWLMWVVARFDKTVRMALDYVGHREEVSNQKAADELGWSPRPPTWATA